jgi:hypothetical protein
MSLRHDSAPRHNPLRPSGRPIDRAIAAIERGKLVPGLLSASRMRAERIISGRAFGRHGHTPHARRCA